MTHDWPVEDLVLAGPEALPPFAVIEGKGFNYLSWYGLDLGGLAKLFAKHDFYFLGRSALRVNDLPNGLDLGSIGLYHGDGIVPGKSTRAIGGTPIRKINAWHNPMPGIAPRAIANEWQDILRAIYPHKPLVEPASVYFLPTSRPSIHNPNQMVVRVQDYLFLSSKVTFALGGAPQEYSLASSEHSTAHRRRRSAFQDQYGRDIQLLAREVSLPIHFPSGSYVHHIDGLGMINAQGDATDPASQRSFLVLTPASLMWSINQKELDVGFSPEAAYGESSDLCLPDGGRHLTVWRWQDEDLPLYIKRNENITKRFDGDGRDFRLMGHSVGSHHLEAALTIPKLANEAIVLGPAQGATARAHPYLVQMTNAIQRLLSHYGTDQYTRYLDLEDLLTQAGATPAMHWDFGDVENCLDQIEKAIAELATPLKRFEPSVYGQVLNFPIVGFSEFCPGWPTLRKYKMTSGSGSMHGSADIPPHWEIGRGQVT